VSFVLDGKPFWEHMLMLLSHHNRFMFMILLI